MSSSVRFVSALLSGSLLALAFPGTGDQGWLALGALVPLLLAVEGAHWRRTGVLGFASGLIFWLATIPWIAPTMVRYGDLPGPLAVLVLLGLAGYLALYSAAFSALLSRIPLRSGALYVVVVASLWVALEFLRTHLLTGFPWNLLGYSQQQNLPMIQVAAITGVYGVSFVVVAVNAGLARVLQVRGNWTKAVAPVGAAVLFWGLAVGSGWLRTLPENTKPSIPIAVVQGNIEQGVKWDPAWQEKTLAAYRGLTLEAARERPKLVVWPETAVPFFLREDSRRAEVEALAREAGVYLLVGAPDRQGGQPRNSAFLVGPDGRMLGQYDKRHLVPFGEYVPLRRLLFFVNVLAGGAIGEFAPGREATVFSTPLGRFGVVICYEAIFPDEVREFFRGGADFLVNMTNDAWFGRSAAPAQHLAMAAFRAVENRAYLIRAANTGISAIVAPDGQIARASGLFATEVISAAIAPRAGASFYTRYGDVLAWATVAVALASALSSLGPIGLRSWRDAAAHTPLRSSRLAQGALGRRGILLALPLGVGTLATGVLAALGASRGNRREYEEVARWRLPAGEGRFITVGPDPTPDALRALGERLREEFRRLDNAVVMIFDNLEAARDARQGSRVIGEERFQAALLHQRAMYVKQSERGEHRLVIYDRYPNSQEVIQY